MAKPPRDRSTALTNTYFVTANAYSGQALFQSDRVANLLIETINEYRHQGKYLLHEFVIMPDHLHLLFTTSDGATLERAIQLIKGGFSHRAGRQLEIRSEIWQRGYLDHRIRDAQDFSHHRSYIHENPVKAHLADAAEHYKYSSAFPGCILDEPPQGLKPNS